MESCLRLFFILFDHSSISFFSWTLCETKILNRNIWQILCIFSKRLLFLIASINSKWIRCPTHYIKRVRQKYSFRMISKLCASWPKEHFGQANSFLNEVLVFVLLYENFNALRYHFSIIWKIINYTQLFIKITQASFNLINTTFYLFFFSFAGVLTGSGLFLIPGHPILIL